MRSYFLLAMTFTAAVLFNGCEMRCEYNVRLLDDNIPTQKLSGEIIDVPDLASPSRIYYCDSMLLFKDNVSLEAQMYVYDFRNKVTNKFIRRGRGPGELLGAFYFAFTDDMKKALVFDVSQRKILIADTDSLRYEDYYPERIFNAGKEINVSCIAGYGNKVIALGNSGDERVVEIPQNDSSAVLSRYCPDLAENTDDDFVLRAYEGVLKANVARHSCVIACRYADQIEIVDMETGVPLFVKGPENFEPMSKVVNAGGGQALSHSADEKKGYVDVCCSDDFIYALYSGRETKERNSSYGRIVRVLTWDGDAVCDYVLDRDVVAIDFSSRGGCLYAISSMGDVVKYNF